MTQLEDLVGEHVLTGVDMASTQIEQYRTYENCQVLNFTLDGVTYSAVEDPSDGYRSTMRYLIVSDTPTSNTFAGVRVIGSMCLKGEYGEADNILELRDINNGKVVLRAGTHAYDDYYPTYVAEWSPENLSINEPDSKDY